MSLKRVRMCWRWYGISGAVERERREWLVYVWFLGWRTKIWKCWACDDALQRLACLVQTCICLSSGRTENMSSKSWKLLCVAVKWTGNDNHHYVVPVMYMERSWSNYVWRALKKDMKRCRMWYEIARRNVRFNTGILLNYSNKTELGISSVRGIPLHIHDTLVSLASKGSPTPRTAPIQGSSERIMTCIIIFDKAHELGHTKTAFECIQQPGTLSAKYLRIANWNSSVPVSVGSNGPIGHLISRSCLCLVMNCLTTESFQSRVREIPISCSSSL